MTTEPPEGSSETTADRSAAPVGAGQSSRRAEDYRSAMTSLAAAVPEAARKTSAPSASHVLAASVAHLCAVIGQPVPAGLASVPDTSARIRLRRTLEGIGLRFRPVALDKDFFAGTGAFLVWRGGQVLTLTSSRPGRWQLTDHASGESRRVTVAVGEELDNSTLQLMPSLPEHPVKWSALLRLGLRGSGRLWLIIALCSLLGALLSLVFPAMTNIVFSEIVPGGQEQRLPAVFAVLLLSTAASGLLAVAISRAVISMRGKGEFEALAASWDRVLRLPAGTLTSYSSGELLAMSAPVGWIRDIFPTAVISSTLAGLVGASAVVMLLVSGWQIFLVVLITWLLELAILMFLMVRFIRERAEQAVEVRAARARLLQIINGINDIAVSQARERALRHWAEAMARQTRAVMKVAATSGSMSTLTRNFPALGALVIVCAVVAFDPTVTTAEYLVIAAASAQLFAATTALSRLAWPVAAGVVELRQIQPLLAAPLESNGVGHPLPDDFRGDLEVDGVSYRYGPDQPLVLQEVSLRARPGEFVALVGPSGSGKSTLLRLLLGFASPESGTVSLDENDLASLDLTDVRSRLGTVLQDTRLLRGTLAENIAAGRNLTDEEIWRAAEAARVADEIRAMPLGMNTYMAGSGSSISGGQRQRIAIARALVGDPRVILFDEATSALDSRTQAEITDYLNSLGRTRVVIAHRLSTIRAADRIYVFEHGRVVESGDYEELMALDGAFARHARRQLTSGAH